MKLLRKYFGSYALEVAIVIVIFLVWQLRKLFSPVSGLFDAAGAAVAGATAKVQVDSRIAQQKASIKVIFPDATDANIAQFEADAEALAQACGAKSYFFMNAFNVNWHTAYEIAKRYSHKMYRVRSDGTIVVLANRALKYRLPVLFEFYKSASNGRSLMADLDEVMMFAGKPERAFYQNYVK